MGDFSSLGQSPSIQAHQLPKLSQVPGAQPRARAFGAGAPCRGNASSLRRAAKETLRTAAPLSSPRCC